MQAMARNWEFFDAPVAIIVTVDRAVDKNGWGAALSVHVSTCESEVGGVCSARHIFGTAFSPTNNTCQTPPAPQIKLKGHVGALLQSICLLAEERGLATCLQEAWGNLGSTVYDQLGIPAETEAVWCAIALVRTICINAPHPLPSTS